MVTVIDNRKKNKQTNYGSLAVGCMFFMSDEDDGLFIKVTEPREKNIYTAFSFLNKVLCYVASGEPVTIVDCTVVVEE